MSSPPLAPRHRPPEWVRQFAAAMQLPVVLVGSVLIGGGFGWLLDRWLHTDPVFMLVVGFIGFGAGVWDVLRSLRR
jgi:ATP synthase protein I